MARNLKITIFTVEKFECGINNIVMLLKKANFSITDPEGFVHVFNERCEWEKHKGEKNDLQKLEKDRLLFEAFGDNGQVIKAAIQDKHSFTVWSETAPVKVTYGKNEYFDLNWYNENLIHAFNNGETIVERAVFEQY